MRCWRQGEWGACVVEGAGQLPKKHFCHQNDKFWCILPQFLTGRKHGSNWDTDFTVQSRNYKAYKNNTKN